MYYGGFTSFKHKFIAASDIMLHRDLTVVVAQLLKIGRIVIFQAPFRKTILIRDQIA